MRRMKIISNKNLPRTVRWENVGQCEEGKYMGKRHIAKIGRDVFDFESADGTWFSVWETAVLAKLIEQVPEGIWTRMTFQGQNAKGVRLFEVAVEDGDGTEEVDP